MKVLFALILSAVVCGQVYGQGPKHPSAGVGTGGTGAKTGNTLFGVGTGGTGYSTTGMTFGVGTGGTGDGTARMTLGVGTGGTGDTVASLLDVSTGGLISFVTLFYSALSK